MGGSATSGPRCYRRHETYLHISMQILARSSLAQQVLLQNMILAISINPFAKFDQVGCIRIARSAVVRVCIQTAKHAISPRLQRILPHRMASSSVSLDSSLTRTVGRGAWVGSRGDCRCAGHCGTGNVWTYVTRRGHSDTARTQRHGDTATQRNFHYEVRKVENSRSLES